MPNKKDEIFSGNMWDEVIWGQFLSWPQLTSPHNELKFKRNINVFLFLDSYLMIWKKNIFSLRNLNEFWRLEFAGVRSGEYLQNFAATNQSSLIFNQILTQTRSQIKLIEMSKLYMGMKVEIHKFNPQAPVTQKIADEVVFWRFQGELVEFF